MNHPLEKSEGRKLSTWKNVCVKFMKAYQDQNVERMIGYCDPNGTVCFRPLEDQGKGLIHELGKQLWMLLIDCFPDIDNTVHSMLQENGKIFGRVSIRGTQVKDFAGIPSQGLKFDSEHIFVFTLDENHQIQHIDVDWDHADFQRQLM